MQDEGTQIWFNAELSVPAVPRKEKKGEGGENRVANRGRWDGFIKTTGGGKNRTKIFGGRGEDEERRKHGSSSCLSPSSFSISRIRGEKKKGRKEEDARLGHVHVPSSFTYWFPAGEAFKGEKRKRKKGKE